MQTELKNVNIIKRIDSTACYFSQLDVFSMRLSNLTVGSINVVK
jgi:hypothetical protein